jgi:hypothetical protein
MNRNWPVVEIDPVTRLRALAAALPHTVLHERVIDAPLERVWSIAGDLEHGVPLFEGGINAVEVEDREGELLRVTTHHPLGIRVQLDAVLRTGWCVMHSRFADIGMAASAEGDGSHTRFAHYEGSPWLGRLGHPLFSWRVKADMERLATLACRA